MSGVSPTAAERRAALPGDDIVPDAGVVMDRAFDLAAPPAQVWPWMTQLGKGRAGWYLPGWCERAVPAGRRATRAVEAEWQGLAVGDVVADWGGRDATFEVAVLEPGSALVYRSPRGHVDLSWAVILRPRGAGTRVQLRLRLGGVRRRWLARALGGGFDRLTIVGLAAGLRERVASDVVGAR